MKKNKFLSLLAVALAVVWLGGCKTNDIENQAAQVNNESTATTESVEIKTIEPPEDGWTLEDLLSVTYIYGNQLTVPCTLESLGKAFSFEKSNFSKSKADASVIIGTLKYNDSVISVINIAESNVKDIDSQSTINRLIFNKIYSDGSNNAVTVNGISLKSSKNQVIKRFGEPDFVPNYVGEDYCYVYYEANTENKLLTINFDNDDNVFLIDINLNN